MTRSEKKEQIQKIKRIIQSTPNKRAGLKFTYIEMKGTFLQISHTPHAMTANCQKEFDDRMVEMGFPTAEELKEMFEVMEEKGSVDNHYYLELRMKAVDRNKIKQIRGQRIGNIPNAIKI